MPAEAQVFSSTVTPLVLSTARSGLPSPLKSPTVAKKGFPPVSKLTGLWNVPSPFQNYRDVGRNSRSEEHTSELQSQSNLVCRLLLEKKKTQRCVYTRLS